jgi:hypothetical protein
MAQWFLICCLVFVLIQSVNNRQPPPSSTYKKIDYAAKLYALLSDNSNINTGPWRDSDDRINVMLDFSLYSINDLVNNAHFLCFLNNINVNAKPCICTEIQR